MTKYLITGWISILPLAAIACCIESLKWFGFAYFGSYAVVAWYWAMGSLFHWLAYEPDDRHFESYVYHRGDAKDSPLSMATIGPKQCIAWDLNDRERTICTVDNAIRLRYDRFILAPWNK